MSQGKIQILLGGLLFVGASLTAGCRVANEYASRAEAVQVSSVRKNEIAAIGALGRNYRELWMNGQKLNEWKQSAIPTFEQAGVTTAELISRHGNQVDRKTLLSRAPESGVTQGSGGWIPVPGRYPIVGHADGGVVASRGRCSLYNQEHTLYAYDFFGPVDVYWLRIVFWEPQLPPD